MKGKALVVDFKYCTGCHSCEVACRNEKGIPLDEWGIKLADMGPAQLGGKWTWDYIPIPSQLCDLCTARIETGQKPACVHHCLAQCLEVVDIDDLPATLKQLGDGAACFVPFQ
ncbi:oxidoreductase [Gordonibacter sp. 28C]|nr:oxidoreductase [Gordonibacter sp. 28C]